MRRSAIHPPNRPRRSLAPLLASVGERVLQLSKETLRNANVSQLKDPTSSLHTVWSWNTAGYAFMTCARCNVSSPRCSSTVCGICSRTRSSCSLHLSSPPHLLNLPVLIDINTGSARRIALDLNSPNMNYAGEDSAKEDSENAGVDDADRACKGDDMSRLEDGSEDGGYGRTVQHKTSFWNLRFL
ncbi:hypothetical protein BDQ17DRAFT_1369829 [Cyathus striatus]|nr:hypothetical protein BDQ17DRAFT_1369829 [Cyathus striatus]